MTARTALRAGLILLAAMQALVGAWALLAPGGFYDDFPWVALLSPYNEHLVRDVGALNLALTLVLSAAALTMDRLLVRVALLALIVFAVPHTIFHATHLEGFPTPDGVAQTVATLTHLLLTGGLLALAWQRLPGRRPSWPSNQTPE